MKIYCQIIVFLFSSLVFLSGPGANAAGQEMPEQKRVITIGSEPEYPPFCMIDDDGNPYGFSVEIFKAAADAVGLEVHIKIGIWRIIKQDLAAGLLDALPLVGRTPEREKLFDFTMPYM